MCFTLLPIYINVGYKFPDVMWFGFSSAFAEH